MREIRLRVWDKRDRKMDYSPGPTWDDVEYGQDINEIIGAQQDRPGILMQYTGLKDKNGKEIYEGDIVVYRNRYGNFSEVIEWGEMEDREGIGYVGFNVNINNMRVVEVIGNIYENPELLSTP